MLFYGSETCVTFLCASRDERSSSSRVKSSHLGSFLTLQFPVFLRRFSLVRIRDQERETPRLIDFMSFT